MLPEIADDAGQLDPESCDPVVLAMLEDCLLQAHHAEPALQLAERCLPMLRAQLEAGKIQSFAMGQHCLRLFHLRAGHLLRSGVEEAVTQDAASAYLTREIPDLLPDYVARVAEVLNEPAPRPGWKRADFVLPDALSNDEDAAHAKSVHLQGTLLVVARESWRHERIPPECGVEGLNGVLDSLQDDRELRGAKQGRRRHDNLLDALTVEGLEARLMRSSANLMVFNFARGLCVLEAHEMLLQLAHRHTLLPEKQLAAAAAELGRLRAQLSEGWLAREM
jgi:hypothetical protein